MPRKKEKKPEYEGPQWQHHTLLRDLATFMFDDKIVFAESGVDSRWLTRGEVSVPDVLTLNKSYTRPAPTIYDIKVSRSDFNSSFRKDKWMRYLPYCTRFYFAAPKGLLKKADIPEKAGLFVRGPDSWYTVKTPKVLAGDGWDTINVQALLMSGAFTARKVRQLRDRVDLEDNCAIQDRVNALGWELSRAVAKVTGDEAAGGPGGAEVLRAVSATLNIPIPALIGMRENDIRSRLVDRDKLDDLSDVVALVGSALKWYSRDDDRGDLLKRIDKVVKDMKKNG